MNLREIDWAARRDRRALWVLGVLLVVVGALLIYAGRGETFFYDEWAWVELKVGGGLQSLLEPQNEHFTLVPILIYKALFHIVGLNHYQVFRLVPVLMHLFCVVLLYDLASRRIGAWPALIAAALLLVLFTAWQNLLWAFQMTFMGSILGGLAAWALLDRDTRRCDIGACLALAVALSCSGVGLPFVPGLAAEIAWRHRWRRLWLVAVPFALYLVWYSQYGHNIVSANLVIESPQWIMDAAAAGAGALIGRDTDWGIPLMLLLLALGAWRFVAGARVSPRLFGATITALAYWTLVGFSRSTIQAPNESRYVYLSAVCLLVIAVELLPPLRCTGRAMAIGGAVVLVSALMGWETLHNDVLPMRSDSEILAAQLGGMQILEASTPAGYAPNPGLAPNLRAGPYFQSARVLHSFAGDSPATLLAANSALQSAADTTMLQILSLAPEPTTERPSGAPPSVQLPAETTVRRAGSCVYLHPQGADAVIDATVPPGGVLITNGGRIPETPSLRRFSPSFIPLGAGVGVGMTLALKLPADAAPSIPWRMQIGIPGPMRLCRLAPTS